MNILYLGQYRDKGVEGTYSSFLLKDLSNIGSVTSRSIITSTIPLDTENIFWTENTSSSNYDILVQRLPIDQLCYVQDMEKNIAIPILGRELLSEDNIDYLNLFDGVLVDTQFNKTYLDKILKKPSILYRLKFDGLLAKENRQIVLGPYSQMRKFYTIVDYGSNKEYVFDLLSEFISSTLNQENICLLIYLLNVDSNTVAFAQNQVSEISGLCHISPENIPRVAIIPAVSNITELNLVHKSGDIFLDLQDASRNSLNTYLAQSYDNDIVSLTEENTLVSCFRDHTHYNEGYRIFNKRNIRQLANTKTFSKMTDPSPSTPYLDTII